MSADAKDRVGQILSDLLGVNEAGELQKEAIKLLLMYAQNEQSLDRKMPGSEDLLIKETSQYVEALSKREKDFGELGVLYKAARDEIGSLRSKVMKERLQKAKLRQSISILKQAYILSTEMHDEHLSEINDEALARELFTSSVSMVEIEVFSYCNRVCWFCPNAVHDRRSANHHMKHDTYIKILEDLQSCKYSNRISFSRYNEPLADRIITERISEARKYLPYATLHMNTNGDYLNKDYLSELYDAGLRSLNIQIYLNNEEKYEHDKVKKKLEKRVYDLELEVTDVVDTPDTWLEVVAQHHDLKIRMYGRNFDENGCDRGGTVEVQNITPRISPCRSPFHHMYIDYNGAVMPCCNVRSDIPEHKQCKVGVMDSKTSLFKIYTGAKAASWRRAMVGFRPKEGVCKFCNFKEFTDAPETRKAQEIILKVSKKIGKRSIS